MKNTRQTAQNRMGMFSALLMVLMAGSAFLFSGPDAALAGIPEPETLLYGRVINRSGGQEYLLIEGQMEWVISDHENGGTTFTFTTDLEPLGEGQFSYRLRIPHEAALAGEILSSDGLPVYSEEIRYDHASVTVNGAPAAIIPPAQEFFNVSQVSRMTPYRIDLEVVFELADTDGDGMPDWWEDKYGLDKDDPDDAYGDPDGDGAGNLAEYLAGADPLVSNVSPEIATARVSVYESAITAVYPGVYDSDSTPGDITYTMISAPDGGTLYLRDGSGSPDVFGLNTGRILSVNDAFTQEDVNQGRLQFSHDDVTVTDISFDLSVADENSLHPSSNGTIAMDIIRPTAQDGTQAALWLDANHAAAQHAELTVWQDRSGPKEWFDGSTAPFDMTEVHGVAVPIAPEAPNEKPVLVLDGALFKGPEGNEAAVLNSGPRTLFAVFMAEGAEDQKVVNNPDFDLAVADGTDGHAGAFRYGASGMSVYTGEAVAGRWVMATVQAEGNDAELEINGRWAGGPEGFAEDNTLGQSFSVGGAIVSRFDTAQGGWVTEGTDLFTGRMAEILAFDYKMDNADRRKIAWHLLSKWFGYVICDGADNARNQSLTAPDGALRPYVLLGGPGDDILSGGGEDDVLCGGPGDDALFGGEGADLFVFNDIFDGNDVIKDFSAGQSDAIDLTGVLNGTSALLSDYIQITNNGTDTFLHINADGEGAEYTDMVIVLEQNMFGDEHISFLWASGNLSAGSIRSPLQVGLQVANADIIENSGDSSIITLGFTGDIPLNLNIPVQVEGQAVWKTDYLLQARLYNTDAGAYELTELDALSVPARLKSGDQSLEIHIVPIEDDEKEGVEDIQFTLLEQKSLYDIVAPAATSVTISDGPASVTITAVQGSIEEGTGIGDKLTISRSGLTDEALEVSLSISGSADNGVDHTFIPESVTFSAGQSNFMIPVNAYTDQTVEPVEYIQAVVIEGPGYVPGDPKKAVISIIDPEGPIDLPVLGNLNGDSIVDLKDAILALQILTNIPLEVEVYKVADVNGDARLGLEEAVYVLQVVAGTRK